MTKPLLTRRNVLQGAIATTVVTAGFPMINLGSFQALAASPARYSARTMRIVERSLVIDMLSPLKLDFRPEAYAGAAVRPAHLQQPDSYRQWQHGPR